MIEIWEPRYSTNSALIGTQHIKDGDNFIKFTKAKHLRDKVFVIDGAEAREYPSKPNGQGRVYIVPMDKLKPVL